MSADDPNIPSHGTVLVNQILEVLDGYLGTRSATAESSSPRLSRLASRTGMAVGQKKLNIEKAKELREGLLVLKDIPDEDVVFESAYQQLSEVTKALLAVDPKSQSTTLLPKLKGLQEANYEANLNVTLKSANVFEGANLSDPEHEKTRFDLGRNQTTLSFDNRSVSEIMGKEYRSDEWRDISLLENLIGHLKKNKSEAQQALIEETMPFLNQNGVLWLSSIPVAATYQDRGFSPVMQTKTDIKILENAIEITETYTIEQIRDVSDPTELITLDNPEIFEHKFTVTRNEEGKLEAKTTSLHTAHDIRPDTPGHEVNTTDSTQAKSGRDRPGA